MKNAIVVDANDVKRILAEHFDVGIDEIIKSQYSYTIIIDNKDGEKKTAIDKLIAVAEAQIGHLKKINN